MNNSTAFPARNNLPPPELSPLIEAVKISYLVSGIYLSIIAVITALGNGLLLIAIIKDPFKSFRTPTTVFVVGLALADFLTGLIVDPLTAFLNIAFYLELFYSDNPAIIKVLEDCINVNSRISFITMNASFLILLSLTFCQYIAISFPHKHRTFVTKRTATIVLVVIAIYSVVFSLLPEFKVPLKIKLEIDLHLNTNSETVFLILCYCLLFRAYRVHLKRVRSLDENDAARKRREEQKREFTAVNLLLVTFLLLFTLPSIILWHLRLYKYYDRNLLSLSQNLRLELASVLIFDVLVMKFALDPYIYAWRLSKYRQAIKSIMKCAFGRAGSDIETNSSSRTISTYVEGGANQERGRTGSVVIPLNNSLYPTASVNASLRRTGKSINPN